MHRPHLKFLTAIVAIENYFGFQDFIRQQIINLQKTFKSTYYKFTFKTLYTSKISQKYVQIFEWDRGN